MKIVNIWKSGHMETSLSASSGFVWLPFALKFGSQICKQRAWLWSMDASSGERDRRSDADSD